MVQLKYIQPIEHQEIDWKALERGEIQLAPAAELVERDVEQDGGELGETESEVSGPVSWEAWKARKRMCAPL